jgi:bifunctional UDP-N-acetylglucosamine pyrophosphorylase/glucosamine-1-phosphate N-acetyltransferase
MRETAVIILAAGQGTRMKSSRAKVLHELCGRPMLAHSLAVAESFAPERLFVIVGRDSDQVEQAFSGRAEFVLQSEQRGTGHAVLQAEPKLGDFDGEVLILYADTPLLRVETLERMKALKAETQASLVMLSALLPLPGRVVRGPDGKVERIVETTDATPEELAIEEGNTGVYLLDCSLLREALANLDDDNEQAELYITDVVEHAVSTGHRVEALRLDDARECMGVNTRAELAQAAAVLRERTAERCMAEGVTLVDPLHTYIDVDVQIGQDTLIEPGCVIGAGTVIGANVHVKANCTIEDSRLDDGVVIGPSAHLRPGTHLMEGVRIGNFVEVKNSTLGPGAKADHLSYIGDADVGAGASFGCGSIVVNYDGIEKHRTVVGDRAFVGCNANLIAPVTIEQDAFVAAGSTITKTVPQDALAVARASQKHVEGWVAKRQGRAPAKKSQKAEKPSSSGNSG